MSDGTAVIDEKAEMEAAKTRTPLTAEQKKAAGIRREITLLQKYPGNEATIAKLQAEADALAPASVHASRVDPMTALTPEEQQKLRTHFQCSKAGFPAIAAVVSYNKLVEIASKL